MALPLGYPGAPVVLWRTMLWLGLFGMLVSGTFLVGSNLGGSKFLPISLMSIGAILLIIGASWFFTKPSPVALNAATTFIECQNDFLPQSIPANGRLIAIKLSWSREVPHQGGQNEEYYGEPGTPLNRDEGGWPRDAYRCEMRTYGQNPLFNALLEFEVEFNKPTITGGSGDKIAEAKTNIMIPRVDTGKDGQFTFYIFNVSSYWVKLTLPTLALTNSDMFGSIGDKISVSSSPPLGLTFSPFVRKVINSTANPP